MLMVNALNVTGASGERSDGTADYIVHVKVNSRIIWGGTIKNHLRKDGAAQLLRLIADNMEVTKNDAAL